MTAYRVAATDAKGRRQTIAVEANARDSAAAAVRSRGLFPIAVTERRSWFVGSSRMSSSDTALGLRVLARLMESGLPLMRSLHAMQSIAPESWSRALPVVRENVQEGRALSDAIRAAGVLLPETVSGTIRAGESGASAASAVGRAARVMESMASSRSALLHALAYPTLLAIASIISVSILVGAVLPRFYRILSELGEPVPPVMAALMTVSGWARAGAVPMTLMAAGATAVWWLWRASSTGRVMWHDWLLRTPGVGAYRQSAGTARVAESMAALLHTGVPVSAALQASASAAGDAAIEHRILAARAHLADGKALFTALGETRAFTPTALFLVSAAEETGELAAMVEHAGQIEGERATRMLQTFVRMVEPVLIMLLAGVIALVASAMLQALYSIQPSI